MHHPARQMPARSHRSPGPARQKGMATLWIVLMVGLAVSVTVAASIYALRGDQQRQVTTHSVTAAQAAAWRGVEVVRRYLLAVDPATMAGWANANGGLAMPATFSGMGAIGIPDGNAQITALSGASGNYQVAATITALAGSGSTTTSATVEVLYDVTPGGGGTPTSPVCATIPAAPMVFNGDLNITGGSLGVTNPTGFENIAVAGSITLSGASQASISGCAKGDVTLSGGGILSGGHVHSQGTIRINQMGNPSNTTLWGRNVTIGSGVSGGNYTAVKAGAYAASVYSGGTLIGTTEVGGRLIASTVSGGLPWSVGTVLPSTSGRIVVTLASGDTWLLDLSALTTDPGSGAVTGAASAQHLSGTSTDALPDQLTFRSTGIAGGTITLATLTIEQLWGHYLSISGWGGRYTAVLANGDVDIVTGTIGSLVGGRDITATQAGLYWNFPTVGNGTVAGELKWGGSRQTVPDVGAAMPGLRTRQSGTTPGLPGIPFCDTRVDAIDVSTYRDGANYIFEWLEGAPHLTIRNVRNKAGQSMDGVYNLATQDVRRLPANGAQFLTCNWNQADNGAAHCFRDKTATGAWTITGLTHLPRGVFWFDAALKIDGTQLRDDDGNRDLLTTLIAKGYVTLTQSGHDRLIAPNFSTPARICDGDYYPSNLCDKTGASSQFTEWTDAADTRHRGLPIGNVALVTESGAQLSGWEIHGNVILGSTLATAAQTTVIHGSLTVGTNSPGSATTIQQGGAQVIVPLNGDNHYNPGICEAPSVTPGGPAAATVRWSRYR